MQVSVIVAVHNGENYLEEALHSLLAQKEVSFEIIVIDDGSSDGTKQILDRYSSFLTIIEQPNRGLGASRNRGILQAQGKYIAFLDHDDLWAPDKLKKQLEAMEKTSNDPLLFSHVTQFFCPTLSEKEKEHLSPVVSEQVGYVAGSLLISKTRFFEVGLFDETLRLGEFIAWYLKAKQKNIPERILQEPLLFRRIHKENMGRRFQSHRTDYLKILKAHLDAKRKSPV